MLATIQNIDRQTIEEFLYAEARCLDEKDWDGWLAHYTKDAVFWMPAWDDDDKIVEDPQREISLVYYGSKQGLEDRVFRIRTEPPAPPASRNRAPAITSVTSKFWSRARASSNYGSTGSR
jgi:3-phenylpropionate/cinnamic acid dioxygenase small subunit